MSKKKYVKRCDIKYKYISKRLDSCVRKMQRELQKKEKKRRVTYVLASDELARRLLK